MQGGQKEEFKENKQLTKVKHNSTQAKGPARHIETHVIALFCIQSNIAV